MEMREALDLCVEIKKAAEDPTTPVGACGLLNYMFRDWRRRLVGNALASVGVKDGEIVVFVSGDENAKEAARRYGLPDIVFPIVWT